MRSSLSRTIIGILVASALAGSLAGCGSAPTGDLWYVWPSSGCPKTSSPVNQNKPAGFTSKSIAQKVAAAETVGPPEYWRKKIAGFKADQAALDASSRTPSEKASPQATITSELTDAYAQLHSFSHCTRYVRKGKPNPQYPY